MIWPFRRKSKKRMARIVIDEPITSSTRISVLKSLLNKYVVIRTSIPAGNNLNEATKSGPALDTSGVIAAIEVPQRAKGIIIKNQFRIEFISCADSLFKVVLCFTLKE